MQAHCTSSACLIFFRLKSNQMALLPTIPETQGWNNHAEMSQR